MKILNFVYTIMYVVFVMFLFVLMWYFSYSNRKITEQIELKNAKIMELQTKNADYSRIHRWIPILEQLLTPMAKAELNALAEKLIQEKARNYENSTQIRR